MSGEMITAQQAYEFGFGSKVLSSEKYIEESDRFLKISHQSQEQA